MNFAESAKQLLETLRRFRRLVVFIKGYPDPDALASSYVIQVIAGALGGKADIISSNQPSLPQNVRFIKDLQLPVAFRVIANAGEQYDGYVIADHQSVQADGLTGVIPCALHIDHHQSVGENFPVAFKLQSNDVGSASTILAMMWDEFRASCDLPPNSWRKMATALCFGIQTDTDNMRLSEALDVIALGKISAECDWNLIAAWTSSTLSQQARRLLNRARLTGKLYKDWYIAGLGFVDEETRDEAVVLADHLLRQKVAPTVVIFFIMRGDKGMMLNASFRSTDKELDINSLIRRVAKNGGARKFKGAFQVDLDYFKHSSNPELLWKLVEDTTMAALKKQRDNLEKGYMKAFFEHLKNRFREMFPWRNDNQN